MGNCCNTVGSCRVCCCFKEILMEYLLYVEYYFCAESLVTMAGALMLPLAMNTANYITLAIPFSHKGS